jgi:tripeptidyl-peptidase-1
LRSFRKDLPDTNTFGVTNVDGGINPQGNKDAGIEANLDTQYTIGIASGVATTFFTVGENTTDGIGGYIDIVNSMENQATIPNVWTTSYAFNEENLDINIAKCVNA